MLCRQNDSWDDTIIHYKQPPPIDLSDMAEELLSIRIARHRAIILKAIYRCHSGVGASYCKARKQHVSPIAC
jgi:predicted phage-related endonuclease